MSTLRRLLIANRGEIACRIMRTAKSMGITTIAVYSNDDADALHVKLADEAIHIGPSPADESYLVVEKIIAAAKTARADAIHPGYGFLSERAIFAAACAEAAITFVGPSPHAISLMGDKARAKRAMIAAGVPCIPGYQGEDQLTATLTSEAKKIGFPLMVKAAAGGGGRGMRLVQKASDLETAIEAAKSEAESAFGSGELILERALIRPRHVEIQVMGDAHGTILHLGERDCSVQRRHQKVIEEAPCPAMTPQLRAQMGAAAVAAARAVDYVGAGTVEFLLGEDGAFYFLEMNTRLQVEHPVTEQVTGLDLVALQLRIAQGHPINLTQEDVRIEGHSIEVRLYAEDPSKDFLPSSGSIKLWEPPSSEGIRVDGGIETGGEVSSFYDPMVAKIIATGATREEARLKLVKALQSCALVGPANNRDFLIDVLEREAFVDGRATTAFIGEEYGDDGFLSTPKIEDWGLAGLIQHMLGKAVALDEAPPISTELLDWASSGKLKSSHVYEDGALLRKIDITPLGAQRYMVGVEEGEMEFGVLDMAPPRAVIQSPSGRKNIVFHATGGASIAIATSIRQLTAHELIPGQSHNDDSGCGRVIAPMHGKLVELLVIDGDSVEKGQRLAVMEAMKMQHDILAGVSGKVTQVLAVAGKQIASEDLILEIEADEESVEA